MKPLIDSLIDYLLAKGIAEEGVYFDNGFPEDPDNIIVLMESEGFGVYRNECSQRNIQICVRNVSAFEASALCNVIYKALDLPDESPYTQLDGRYMFFKRRQPPFQLKRDEQGRVTYAFNMGVMTQPD